ncbi:MAG: tRNA pseudouridine(38-40) synthase TruA, partial [Pirellulales bacterium]|nr:tRNA pseudouridine(38-40) synthase TruA [Pirellulales bacterium]
MRTIKLTIAYEGTAYAGWQYQPDRTTVQLTLETAIEKVTGRRIRVLASGRTDAGVHALGQVVGFKTECKLPPDKFLRALNANLPSDVAVLALVEAPEDFHPISHARRKRYRYVIHDGPVRDVFQRRYAWHYARGRLDDAAMARAAAALRGTHDFSSFETAGAPRESSVRTVFDIIVQRGRAGEGETENKLPSPACGRGAGGEGGVERGRAGDYLPSPA